MSDFHIETFHKFLGEGMTHAEARREFDKTQLSEAVRLDLDVHGLQGELFQLCILANRDESNEDAMVQATELWMAGWTSETPLPQQTEVWQWFWRRPSRRPGKPGKIYRSTNQAYQELKRETARAYVPVIHEKMSPLELKARSFAARHHAAVNQLRRYSGVAYITHPAAVVEIIRSVPHTTIMLVLGWLHDTVEDTKATEEDVRREFGDEIAQKTMMLTNVSRYEDGRRELRVAIDHEHMEKATPDVKTVKLADVIHNTANIEKDDAVFARRYMQEKSLLLGVLTEGDPTLWRLARAKIDEFLRRQADRDKAENS